MYQANDYIIARQKLGLSQSEVAEKTGLRQSVISRVENGKAQKLYKELIDFYVENGIDESLLTEKKGITSEKEEELEKIKEENSFLMRELLEVRRELSKAKDKVIELQDDIINKFQSNNLDLGKAKASSNYNTATLPNTENCKVVRLLA